jgi:hypothetical protein
MNEIKRKIKRRVFNAAEYCDWEYLKSLATGQPRRERRWIRHRNRPVPPPHWRKAATVLLYAEKYGCKRFVETGTQVGEMVHAVQDAFEHITSIEIDPKGYEISRNRFDGIKHIKLLHGDSGKLLPTVLEQLEEAAVFWLDAHGYCPPEHLESNPILIEVESVLKHPVPGHVILVDDARCFGWERYYPSLDELRAVAKRHDANFEVAGDCIRIHLDKEEL